MAGRRGTIPASHTFPGGYEVIVLVHRKTDASYELDPAAFAEWDVTDRTIHLRADRPMKLRKEDFIHEMEHAFVDWKDWYLGKSETKKGAQE